MKKFFIFIVILTSSAYAGAVDLKFITIDVDPWAYYDHRKKSYSGVFPDVVSEIERRAGLSIKIVLSPFGFSRINRELEVGRQDCTTVIL